MDPEVRKLIDKARARGWVLVPAKHGHSRLHYPPTGDIVVIPNTPSEYRSLKNTEALISRISGRLSPKPGPGQTREQRQARRALEKRRADAHARKRTAAPQVPHRPRRTTMEVAFDDFLAEHITRRPDEGERQAG